MTETLARRGPAALSPGAAGPGAWIDGEAGNRWLRIADGQTNRVLGAKLTPEFLVGLTNLLLREAEGQGHQVRSNVRVDGEAIVRAIATAAPMVLVRALKDKGAFALAEELAPKDGGNGADVARVIADAIRSASFRLKLDAEELRPLLPTGSITRVTERGDKGIEQTVTAHVYADAKGA